jgi:hypothetical protein
MTAKTDNHSLSVKFALRAGFLDSYHEGKTVVFDACMGNGELWRRLRVGRRLRYWGVDVKPKRGFVQVDSERVLAMPGWKFDVIDVDTYGMPWGHWLGILRNGAGALTVFLTVGNVVMGGSGLCRELREVVGFGDLKIPPAICGRLNSDFTLEMIGYAKLAGWSIEELKEAVPDKPGTARYFGVRMRREAKTKNG